MNVPREDSGQASGQSGRDHVNSAAPAEWVVGVISAVLVLAALGFVAIHAVRGPTGPPLLTIHADSVVSTPGAHLLMFTVRNDGSETAAAVQVSGELIRDGETIEESGATLDFVPEGARRRGSLQFQEDPGAHTVELRVTGFAFP